MIRKIIQIDKNKCNGCGACANACHEGAIAMVDGKATLLRDDYCDGLGDCLPVCPVDAITFVEREAKAYDEATVKAAMVAKASSASEETLACGCPGSLAKEIEPKCCCDDSAENSIGPASALRNWPVQIKLAPLHAPYFDNTKLLIAADCTAYAYGNFHNAFMKDHMTLIGCPKLDMTDYSEKLAEIIAQNDFISITLLRMEVPCCGGLEAAAKKALAASGKNLPFKVVTISTDGAIL